TANTCVDVFKPNTTVCRPSTGQCDVAESCTGSSGTCPVDAFKSSSTTCTGASQGGACDDDTADHCSGTSGACVDVFQSSSTVCRASAGQCDLAETCTGSSGSCPADAFKSSATSCTGSSQGGQCDNDAGDHCTGTGNVCVDAFKSSATTCTGASQGGSCDNDAADHCSGTANTCIDVFQPSTVVCRGSAGQCDVAENCTGSSGSCPVDVFKSSSTSCTGTSQGGACDNDAGDHCSGTANTCVDVFKPNTTVCRPSTGQCDVDETCTGRCGSCPADVFASSSTSCTGSSQGG